MSKNFLLSYRVMQLLRERLQEDLWYSKERRDMFDDDCESHWDYQDAVYEDEELIAQLDTAILTIKNTRRVKNEHG